MSVLVYAETSEGNFKKSALEVVSYGKAIANQINSTLTVLTINASETATLNQYGADKIVTVNNDALKSFNAKIYAGVVSEYAQTNDQKIVIIDSSADGKYLAPLVSAKLQASFASNVIEVPSSTAPFTVKRKVFSNKGFSNTVLTADYKVINLARNSFGIHENTASGNVSTFEPTLLSSTLTVTNTEKASGKVSIADADVVVSGGRGLKEAANFKLIEDLADVLGAATACSKPVSDMGWRPHGEHVGQTGKPVASNLYIAIGISGAIQHLAGVNASKVKVVINTDAEAPFFKAADYGIVGDAFEVVPQLIEKLKAFKSENA